MISDDATAVRKAARNAVEADHRWQRAHEEMFRKVDGETPYDVLLRQIAGILAMFLVEVEYEERASGRPFAMDSIRPALRPLAMIALGRQE